MSLRIDILTLFPEMFGSFLGTSIPKRAAEKGLVEYKLTNIRDFATDAHLSVDDKPFGGGPGMVMMCQTVYDAVVRLLPGALGAEDGAADETFTDGLIEHPQYTRPREFRGMSVPEVLLSGNHAAIAAWRLEQRKKRTQERRPDLWSAYRDNQRP